MPHSPEGKLSLLYLYIPPSDVPEKLASTRGHPITNIPPPRALH